MRARISVPPPAAEATAMVIVLPAKETGAAAGAEVAFDAVAVEGGVVLDVAVVVGVETVAAVAGASPGLACGAGVAPEAQASTSVRIR
ncbi:MAG: hypothetical protein HYX90_00200 [Chloroflexi bacterium]|nr:hypothetical protein [Chloroflexota bacterium]